MSKQRIKNRRRPVLINYSIKRRMQLRLLFKVMLTTLIALGLTTIFFYVYSNQEVGNSFKEFHIHARSFLDLLLPGVLLALLVGIVIAFVAAVFFPHKIAGPLYRIEKDIKNELGEGNFTGRFTVRKGDEVEELAEALNTMVEKLKPRLDEIQRITEELSDLNEKDEGLNQDVVKLLERLKGVVREFRL